MSGEDPLTELGRVLHIQTQDGAIVCTCASPYLVYVHGDGVSHFQGSVHGPHVQDVASPDLRVLHRELHPLATQVQTSAVRCFAMTLQMDLHL